MVMAAFTASRSAFRFVAYTSQMGRSPLVTSRTLSPYTHHDADAAPYVQIDAHSAPQILRVLLRQRAQHPRHVHPRVLRQRSRHHLQRLRELLLTPFPRFHFPHRVLVQTRTLLPERRDADGHSGLGSAGTRD